MTKKAMIRKIKFLFLCVDERDFMRFILGGFHVTS